MKFKYKISYLEMSSFNESVIQRTPEVKTSTPEKATTLKEEESQIFFNVSEISTEATPLFSSHRKKDVIQISSSSEPESDDKEMEDLVSSGGKHSELLFEDVTKNMVSQSVVYLDSSNSDLVNIKSNSPSLSEVHTGFIPLHKTSFPSSNGLPPSKSREFMEAEQDKLIQDLKLAKSTLTQLKSAIKTTKMSALPDGGANLKTKIKLKESQVVELQKKLKAMNGNIKQITTIEKIEKKKTSDQVFSSIPHSNIALTEMGLKALVKQEEESRLTLKTLERLHSSLARRPTPEIEIPDPIGLEVPLLKHQREALAWLLWRESQKPSGGILADDMGLGKTLTMIALILKQQEDKNKTKESSESSSDSDSGLLPRDCGKGGTLVVCPASVISQWTSEVKTKVTKNLILTVEHQGPKRDKKPHRLKVYDIVITSYQVLQKDDKENNPGPLLSINWERIILDEAHFIRNFKSLTALAAFKLKAKSRWALTGTPIHNKEADLYSLLKFLRCRPFDDLKVWKKWVENKDQAGCKRLDCLTQSLLLRRTKKEVDIGRGEEEREVITVDVQLDEDEWTVYENIARFSSTLLAQLLKQKMDRENFIAPNDEKQDSNLFKNHPELERLHKVLIEMGNVKSSDMLVLFLRLRQICCHLSLVSGMLEEKDVFEEKLVDEDGLEVDITERMGKMNIIEKDKLDNEEEGSLKMRLFQAENPIFNEKRMSSKVKAIVDCLKDNVMKTDDKAIIVSQWTSFLRIIENVLREERISYICLTGSTPVIDRPEIVNSFNTDPKGQKVMLLSLTAGGTGLNLVGANYLLLADVHWNPQIEAQACDRIDRIGQKKKSLHLQVFVFGHYRA